MTLMQREGGKTMRSIISGAVLLGVLALPTHAASAASDSAGSLDTAEIEKLTGLKGTLDEKEHVFKVSAPRKDLKVISWGVQLTPPMGLTSWAAFERPGVQTMVMGDMVLEESQVDPVMQVALDNGLDVTALHNHFLQTSPMVMFMHIGGVGDEAKLAGAVGKVFDKIKETSSKDERPPITEIDPAKSTLDPKKLDAVLGAKGDFKDGVYKAVFGRLTKMHGHEVGSVMGVNTWAAFAGSDDKAVVDGDFAMLESELQPVLKKLRGSGISVVAIHQHMTGEEPRIMFLHYWGIGRAEDLGKGVRGALDLTRGK
jgi:Domain of Unknown Function (DUF1259)